MSVELKAPPGQVRIMRYDVLAAAFYPVSPEHSTLSVDQARGVVYEFNQRRTGCEQDAYRLYDDQGICIMDERAESMYEEPGDLWLAQG